MCVDNMEGYCGAGDCSSEDMASWLSTFKDELDFVGKATMYDSLDEDYLEAPSTSVPLCPISQSTGFSMACWVNLNVVLHNDSGVAVAEGICHNTHPQDSLMKTILAPTTLGLLYWSHSFTLRWIPLKGFHSRGGH